MVRAQRLRSSSPPVSQGRPDFRLLACILSQGSRSCRSIVSNVVTLMPVRRRKLALRRRRAAEKGWDMAEAPSLGRSSFDSIRGVTGQPHSGDEPGVGGIAGMHFRNESNVGH